MVVFLDYDGTLTPIVEIPDHALMSEDMRATVRRLSSKFTTAVVSGRARHKVHAFVQLDELYILATAPAWHRRAPAPGIAQNVQRL